jgi:hypothetical protein
MIKSIGSIVLWILLAAAIHQVAIAQEGSQPPVDQFVTYDPATGEYSLNLDAMTPLGTVVTPAPEGWPVPSFISPIDIGDATFNPFMMTYNRYVTPEGYYVLVPSLYTAVAMTFTGTSPFDVEPAGQVVNGWIGAAGYLGWMESIGYTQSDVENGNWELEPDFFIQLFLAVNDPSSPLYEGAFFAPPAVFIYTCDPTNPADCSGTPDESNPVPQATQPPPPHSDAECPDASTTFSPIQAAGKLVQPRYPTVVGQDPMKRGADLQWGLEIPPVIYKWYEAELVGPIEGCLDDPSTPGNECMRTVCHQHVIVYPDVLASVRPSASLTPDSREWILGNLAALYPGASLYQPDWSWSPPAAGHVAGGGTFFWNWTETRIPFKDPGVYGHSIAGTTSGTPVSGPRSFNIAVDAFTVWLHEATLSQ